MTDSCKHVNRIKSVAQLGILSPERWHCSICQTSESVWACLSCGNFACGRYIHEHALDHFNTTQHPLCFEVNEKFVFCYLCDDFVLNDNPPGDIKLTRMAIDAVSAQNFDELRKEERGRRILRYHIRDPKKLTKQLLRADDVQTAVMRYRISRLSCAMGKWISKFANRKSLSKPEMRRNKGRGKGPSLPPAFTGLRNLGNTCYMNSVLQVLRHTAPFANFVMGHRPEDILPDSREKIVSSNDESSINKVASESSSHKKRAVVVMNPSVDTTIISSLDHGSSKGATSTNSTTLHNSTHSDSSQESSGGLNGGRSYRPTVSYIDPPNSLTDKTMISRSGNDQVVCDRIPSLYNEIYNIFNSLWSGHRSVVSPSSLLFVIWSVIPSFKGYKQQDAEEFLSILLDRLQSEITGSQINSTAPLTSSHDFINRTFQGFLTSHIECSRCGRIACIEEPFSELSLALPADFYSDESTDDCQLIDLLRQFTSPTPIDNEATYSCETCSTQPPDVPNNSSPDLLNRPHNCSTHSAVSPSKLSVSLYRLPSPPTTTCVNAISEEVGSPNSNSCCSSSTVSSSCSCSLISSPSPYKNNRLVSPPSSQPTIAPKAADGCDKSQINQAPSPVKQFFSTQTLRLTRLPRVLRLHIKRFRWIGRQREKIGCHVKFPLILDLSDVMLTDQERSACGKIHRYDSTRHDSPTSPPTLPKQPLFYHLTGVVVHHGRGFQSGHYTAYCLNDDSEDWLHCNDANVTVCDFDEVASSQAYLLFYSELIPSSRYPNWFSPSLLRSASTSSMKTPLPSSSSESPRQSLKRNASSSHTTPPRSCKRSG